MTQELKTSADFLKELVKFPSYEQNGMRQCAEFLNRELTRLRFQVRVDRLNNVLATKLFDGTQDAFLINTHFDTVAPSPKWTRNPLQATVEGNRMYGLGTSDAKGGIAATLAALAKIESSRFRKLEVLFSNYEDNNVNLDGVTWLGTPFFLQNNTLESKTGINVEGTVKDGKFMLSLGCGGRVGFEVTTIGKEAHSSDPRLGRNAIYDMMKVIETLRTLPPARMKLDEHEAYTELNVNVIQGGTAINVVPGRCKITCERRVLPNEDWDEVKKEVDGAISKLKDIEFQLNYYKPQRSYMLDRSNAVVELVRNSVNDFLGYEPRFRVESGRTDSIYFDQMAGIKTVIFGPGETDVAHVPDEYVSVNRLDEFCEVMCRILSP